MWVGGQVSLDDGKGHLLWNLTVNFSFMTVQLKICLVPAKLAKFLSTYGWLKQYKKLFNLASSY